MESSDTSENERKHFKCVIPNCLVAFSKKRKLEDHIKKHSSERPFVCDVPGCSKSYTNPSHLKRHKYVAHEESKQSFSCESEGCGRVFYNKYTYKKHFSNHMSDALPFSCSDCSLKFHKKKQLQHHSYLHTGEVPFKCSSCKLGFTTIGDLKKHKRNHKIYTCECGKEFDRWTLLCAHKRHSCLKKPVYLCSNCDKTFSSSTNLKQHQITHANESEKGFSCPYDNCERSYLQKKNLNYHIKVFHEKHVDNIPCSKDGCSVILKSKKNLKQHLLKMHSNSIKEIVPRRPRHDKGKPKKSMVSVLSGVKLPLKDNLELIKYDASTQETESSQLPKIEHQNNEKETISFCSSLIVKQCNLTSVPSDTESKSSDMSDDALLEECEKTLKTLQEHLIRNHAA